MVCRLVEEVRGFLVGFEGAVRGWYVLLNDLVKWCGKRVTTTNGYGWIVGTT